MADNDSQIDLKKRARRRLVGSAALALAAAIVLPMVMDHEPRPPSQDVQIRIPSQEGSNFTSRVINGKAPAPAQPVASAELDETRSPEVDDASRPRLGSEPGSPVFKPGEELTPGHVTISATAAEMGDNVADLDATIEGDAVEIAFNVKYLVDVLGVIDTPNVALETAGATSPGVIKPVGRDDYIYIVMPMHLGK